MTMEKFAMKGQGSAKEFIVKRNLTSSAYFDYISSIYQPQIAQIAQIFQMITI